MKKLDVFGIVDHGAQRLKRFLYLPLRSIQELGEGTRSHYVKNDHDRSKDLPKSLQELLPIPHRGYQDRHVNRIEFFRW